VLHGGTTGCHALCTRSAHFLQHHTSSDTQQETATTVQQAIEVQCGCAFQHVHRTPTPVRCSPMNGKHETTSTTNSIHPQERQRLYRPQLPTRNNQVPSATHQPRNQEPPTAHARHAQIKGRDTLHAVALPHKLTNTRMCVTREHCCTQSS
jgi:hypothetical protein